MNSLERIRAAAKGGLVPDRVPVAPFMGNYGAALAGIPISRYNKNGKLIAEAQLKMWEMLGCDAVIAQSDNYYIAEGMGTVTESPENETPHIVTPAIRDLDEVDRLELPNPLTDGRMPVYLEAVSILKSKLGGEVAVRGCGTGPFSLAGHLLGTENLLCEMAMCEADEDEEKLKQIMKLMDISTKALIAFSKAMLDAGADIVFCGDSAASPDLVSPAYYEKYIFPFECQFFEQIKPECNKRDAVSILHICGNTTGISALMSKTGADIIEIDYKVNLREARSIVGEDICILGNLDPSSVLLMGTVQDVEQKARECIAAAGMNGRFILGSGCEVAAKTPVENILKMVEVGKSFIY